MSDMKDVALKIAWNMWGKPYLWGGDDPIQGFDCSGMVIEILKSVGLLPRKGDWTADHLYRHFQHLERSEAGSGYLVFWGSSRRMTHVEFGIGSDISLGASGGGHKTTSVGEAIRQNAYVKARPIYTRGSLPKAFVDPFSEVPNGQETHA